MFLMNFIRRQQQKQGQIAEVIQLDTTHYQLSGSHAHKQLNNARHHVKRTKLCLYLEEDCKYGASGSLHRIKFTASWIQSQVESYQRLKKWYLMLSCLTLSIICQGSRVKWSNPGKRVAPFPTPKREPSGRPRLRSPTLLTLFTRCHRFI